MYSKKKKTICEIKSDLFHRPNDAHFSSDQKRTSDFSTKISCSILHNATVCSV